MKRSAFKAKRDTPRRNEGRIQHGRVKPKLTDKTAEVRRFHDYVAALPCVGCLAKPVHVHHILHCHGKETRRDHKFVVPLCLDHHTGRWGVHGLGGEKQFLDHHGVDLVKHAISLWRSFVDDV